MKLLAALQKEARKITKAKANLEQQLNAISAAVKAFGATLAADSASGRKPGGNGRRKPRNGRKKRKMSAAGRAAIAKAQRQRWAKIHAAKKAT